MKILSKLTYRYLKLNKNKSIITLISILLVTTLLFSAGLGISTIRKNSIDAAISFYGPHHFELQDFPLASTVSILNDNEDIEKIGLVQVVNSKQIDDIKINYITFTDNIESYFTVQGNYPKNNQEIIISDTLSKEKNLLIEDTFDNKKIVGIYTNIVLDGENYYEHEYDVYTKDSFLDSIPASYFITFKSINNAYDKIATIAKVLNLNRHLQANEVYYDNTSINNSVLNASGEYYNFSETLGVYAILCLVFVVISSFGILIIHNAFNISLPNRKKELGALRSIGASKRQIFKLVMQEAAMLSIIAIPLGIILSFGIVILVLTIVNKYLENIVAPYQLYIYPEILIIVLIFIVITIILAAINPAIKVSKIPPISTIRGNDTYKSKKTKERIPLIKKYFGTEGELAYKNIKRNHRKFNSSIISCSLSVILFITFACLFNFIMSNVENDYINPLDIIIDIEDKEASIISEILSLPEVDSYVKFDSYYIYTNTNVFTFKYNKKVGSPAIFLIGVDKNFYKKYLKEIRAPQNTTGIAVNKKYYIDKDNHQKIWYDIFDKKDNLKLDITSSEGTIYQTLNNLYTVDNFPYIYNEDATLIVNLDDYYTIKSYYYEDTSPRKIRIGIFSQNFIKLDENIQQIIKANPNISINYSNNTLDEYNQIQTINSIKFVGYSIIIFIALLSITTVFSTLNTNLEVRQKEFSVLRSIGISKKKLTKMLILEGVFLSFEILLITLTASIIIIYFIREAIKLIYVLDKAIIVPYPYSYLLIAIVTVLLLLYLITIYSSYKIKNKNIIDSIKNENI